MTHGLVIVGGSYAAVQAAATARELGYLEPIRIVTDEPDVPYQRPPLSKGFLLGELDIDALPLRGERFYVENDIQLLLGTRIDGIDRRTQTVAPSRGRPIAYDRLLLATGSRARRLQLANGTLDGVISLRSLMDAKELRSRARVANEAVIVGGGYIGLEVAAALATLGKRVTVVEAQGRVLSRTAAKPLAEFVERVHRDKGVEILLNTTIEAIDKDRGAVCSVRLSNGIERRADLVVVGIGVEPNHPLALLSGLRCADGIVVDRCARTSDPLIFAAGDCTSHPSAFADGPLRLESVQNAIDQAKAAAASIAGIDGKPYDAVPWFWSDQYDLKLQIAGISRDYDRYVVRGSPSAGRFSIFYLRRERLIAVDSINQPFDHMLGRRLVTAAARPSVDQIMDVDFDLRSLIGRQTAPVRIQRPAAGER